ncbi:MAG: DUF4389 domain-containing protein [Ketobacter sp.]
MSEDDQNPDSLLLTALYMILFYLIFTLTSYVLIGIGVLQFAVRLLSGGPQPELQRFGLRFGRYLMQIVQYISMQTNIKPYPFSEWPQDAESGR